MILHNNTFHRKQLICSCFILFQQSSRLGQFVGHKVDDSFENEILATQPGQFNNTGAGQTGAHAKVGWITSCEDQVGWVSWSRFDTTNRCALTKRKPETDYHTHIYITEN